MKRMMIASVLVFVTAACMLVLAAPDLKQAPVAVKPRPRDAAGLYHERFSGLRLGAPRQYRGLTVHPLLGPTRDPFYTTLDAALGAGHLVVDELGQVGEVRVTNKGARPVLIVDGEEIVGAKQNRIFSSSMLAPPGQSVIAKVSCVEHGRWSGVSAEFKASGAQLFARARQANQAAVGSSMASAGAPRGDQSRVWADVAAKNESLGVVAETSAMHRAYEEKAADVREYVDRLRPESGQVGAIFAVHGQIIGLDVFDSAETLKELYPKLLKSYALDAITPVHAGQSTAPGADRNAAAAFLSAAARAGGREYKSQGEGTDLRLSGWKLTGGALISRDRVVHAAVFAGDGKEESPATDRTGIAPPQFRRR